LRRRTGYDRPIRTGWCDEHGRKLPTDGQGPFVAWLGSGLETSAVIAQAQATVDVEVQATRDAAGQAYESVPDAGTGPGVSE
jgi:hypothetical protein